jgi:hypothetical protein
MHPALNEEIDPDAYPCEWGYFHLVTAFVASAPLGSQAATFDVDTAYRRMPVHPLDQPHIIVHWDNLFWVDHCVPFGAASSNGIFARCGDAIAHIYERHGMGPVFKWVDDFLFFRSPQDDLAPVFRYSESDIENVATYLGWPWKLAKTHPFSLQFTYLGFEWDIPTCQVSIGIKKRVKYAKRVQDATNGQAMSLMDIEKLLGSLMHCSQVVREGRARLAGIISFSATFSRHPDHQFRRRFMSRRAYADAQWWLSTLTSGPCTLQLCPPFPAYQIPCYMDASTSSGIGVIVGTKFAAWELQNGWRKPGIDIGWAEMVAVELALQALIGKGIHNRSVTFFSDNMGVIYALQAGRSRNENQNTVLIRILKQADYHAIELSMNYIALAQNPADAPSRGNAPQNCSHIDWPFTIPDEIAPLLRSLDL